MVREILKKIKKEKEKFLYFKEDVACQDITRDQGLPIYHIHIRKTAGTTINFAFLSNSETNKTVNFYGDLARKKNHRLIKNSKVFVGWNTNLINEGYYSYAFSHTPLHQLNLPNNIFLFTCLRDPIKRVISHYNMLKYYQVNGIHHPCMKVEQKWLGNSITDFVSMAPKNHVLNQIYMFSNSYSINESLEKLLKLNKVMFTENLKADLKSLEALTNWKLPISNQKKYKHHEVISDNQMAMLREIMDPEYVLINKFKAEQKRKNVILSV